MKKIRSFIENRSHFWAGIFLFIAFINLSVPLFLNTMQENIQVIETVREGFNQIPESFEWETDSFVSQSDDITIRIRENQALDGNYLYFSSEFIEISVNDVNQQIDYDGGRLTQEVAEESYSHIVGGLMMQTLFSFIVAFLLNGLIFLVMLVLGHYLLKQEKFRELYKLYILPFVCSSFVSSLAAMSIQNYYTPIYILSIFLSGVGVAWILKEKMDKRTTNYYFGNEELVNELH